MIYNVAGLLSGELGESRQHEIENERLAFGEHSFKNVIGPVRMMRTDRTVLVNADIEAVTHDTCSRCLEPATVNVSVTLEEEFTPANADLMASKGSRPSGRSVDIDDYYDPALVIDEQNFLDLSEALGQALSGAVSIAPLCKDECLGICPTCTVNRNEIQCACAQITYDPRWGALAGLTEIGAKSAD